MPHFCGRTHSSRDRRFSAVADDPRPRAVDSSPSGAAAIEGTIKATDAKSVLTVTSPGFTPTTPSHEEIAALAYSFWEARGRQGGSPEADWLRAERELSRR